MLKIFRQIALVEGVTTLFLFLIAMPLKYIFDQTALMPVAGWVHGFAFIAYMVTIVPGMWGKGFTRFEWLRTFLAAFIPFGTFLNDSMLNRREELRAV